MVRKMGSEKWLEIALGDAGWEGNGREEARSPSAESRNQKGINRKEHKDRKEKTP
jgi:hypothetical protein